MDQLQLVDANMKPLFASASDAKVTSTAPVANVPFSLLPANKNRRGRPIIVYDGTDVLLVSLGSQEVTATKFSFKMGADFALSYEPPLDYSGEIRGMFLTANGTSNVNATEYI